MGHEPHANDIMTSNLASHHSNINEGIVCRYDAITRPEGLAVALIAPSCRFIRPREAQGSAKEMWCPNNTDNRQQ
jgi:hypothetical protein